VTIDGHAAAAPILRAAIRAFREEVALPPEESRWLSLACRAAGEVWDEESWRLLATRELQRAREAGALTATPLLLSALSYIHVLCGELSTAESLLDEIRATTAVTGIPAHRYVELWVAALRGRESAFSALVEDFTTDVKARGGGLRAGVRRAGRRGFCTTVWVATRRPSRRCATRSTPRPIPIWARRARSLSDGDAAERLYQEAIARLRRTRVRVQLARTHLLYGEWLRRERRRLDARVQLRAALELFTGIGADGFAARAERELSATGERARKRSVETREELTAQEVQVARLARDGLSNSAIGERFFISQHTVAYHLRKVFTKLDVSSRNQLGRVLSQSSDAVGLA
jgi:DNA-binding CsgD family transcriptional regulator